MAGSIEADARTSRSHLDDVFSCPSAKERGETEVAGQLRSTPVTDGLYVGFVKMPELPP